MSPFASFVFLALAGVLALALLLWPRRGLVARWRSAREMEERARGEDALKHIHKSESAGQPADVESVAGALAISTDEAARLLEHLTDIGLARVDGRCFRLTPDGRDYALHVIRAHRLWERYLADETGYAESEWHALAEGREHEMSAAEAQALAAKLGYPTHDPHGDPIPTAEGQVVGHGGVPVTTLAPDTPVRIVHIEDEPDSVYAQIVAEDLHPGMTAHVAEVSATRVRLWSEGTEHVLAPIVAANVYAAPVQASEAQPLSGRSLADLAPGETGRVVAYGHACRGTERRRLMDLGILPGTEITAEFRSPTGDPTAYLVRGAVIALRRRQARRVRIAAPEGVTP